MTVEDSQLHAVANQDGAAILDVQRGVISTLNATGAYVWQRLKRGELPATIIAGLTHETGEDPQIVERDVREFLNTLQDKHLMPR